MEDVTAAKAQGMILMKSIRLKPKLAKMGEDLLIGKDSAIMRSKRWVKDREGQLQRDQSDVPVRFKEIKNVGFTQHRFLQPSFPPSILFCPPASGRHPSCPRICLLPHSTPMSQLQRNEHRMEEPSQSHASAQDGQRFNVASIRVFSRGQRCSVR
jgi:hypothetical protein